MVVVLFGAGSLVQRGLVFTVQRNTKLMQWCDFRLSDLIIIRRFVGFLVPKRILIQGFEVSTGDKKKNPYPHMIGTPIRVGCAIFSAI